MGKKCPELKPNSVRFFIFPGVTDEDIPVRFFLFRYPHRPSVTRNPPALRQTGFRAILSLARPPAPAWPRPWLLESRGAFMFTLSLFYHTLSICASPHPSPAALGATGGYLLACKAFISTVAWLMYALPNNISSVAPLILSASISSIPWASKVPARSICLVASTRFW